MKHAFFKYTILTALAASVCISCATDKAPVKQPAPAAKKLDPKAEAEAKRKAEAEAKRKAEEAKRRAEAEAKKKAEKALQEQRKALTKELEEILKPRMAEKDRLEKTASLLNDPKYADRALQEYLLNRFLEAARPFWSGVGRIENTVEILPRVVNEMVQGDRVGVYAKRKALTTLAYHYCDRQMYKEAEETFRRILALQGVPVMDVARSYVILSDIYRYQEHFDDAMNALKQIENLDEKSKPALHVLAVHEMADLYLKYDREAEAEKLIDSLNDPYDKLMFYQSIGHAYLGDIVKAPKQRWQATAGKALAVKYVSDLGNPENRRVEIALKYLLDSFGTPEMSAARRSLAGVSAQNKRGFNDYALRMPYQKGDYPLTVELCEIVMETPQMEKPFMRNIYVISLACVGRTDDAIRYATKFAGDAQMKPVDQMRFKFYAAILAGKSTDGFLKDTALTRKEQSEILLSAARQCALWNKNDLAKKYTAEHEKFFMQKQEQTLCVKYFDQPISNISEWRKIYGQLDKKYCDIPFKGSMDFLETDVSTGPRSVHFEKDAKIQSFMEVTSLCDIEGIHIFLRVEDKNARSIQAGFANGIGTEMYFAPGRNQPYVCMGSEAAKGVTFMFQTTYSNRGHRRPEFKNPASFRQETEFTDTDYVLHMCFNWKDLYNKLPAVSGTDYRYECIAWTPAGGFSWGGSQGIHSASSWGNLRIQITEKQLNAIRKRLIFETFRTWKNIERNNVTVNLFDFWADDAIGDPDFYKTSLEPLQKDLEKYAAMVKENMTDADVKTVYTKGAIRWMGLQHEIDHLRRVYLSRQLSNGGK